MLVSLINASSNLLSLFWAVSFLLLGVSLLLCLVIIIRRAICNRISTRRETQKNAFQAYLSNVMKDAPEHTLKEQGLRNAPACHIMDMTDVFLHHFRTLKGKKNEYLQDMISDSGIEAQIIKSTYKGIRGIRMRAVRTLSYLNSQTSLQVIFNNLSSDDKYVRLTAARCLVRRKAIFFLNPIIDSCIEAFPQDFKLLAGILAGFGNDMIEPLEDFVRQSDNNVIKTACLEAVITIMPPKTSLDLGTLMESSDKTVRAATLALSAIVKHPDTSDPLLLGLKDDATLVKLRAIKIAYKLKRPDLTPELYKLTSDPIMWVRYWALRAIWVTGHSGQKFIATLAKTNPMAANVSLEMSSGYV